ncbi:hypothetical protein B0J11DRAFT_1664 [Dendryphion nanum]|uniref:Uncharacterized protein n=1 Tax=Dendryphion nanum TaxID=256645 RepID=A0A9P9EJM4_9PLEO|nr:hypothetical protein B0J11DRAFT_1664 [Dendryphion nanum]
MRLRPSLTFVHRHAGCTHCLWEKTLCRSICNGRPRCPRGLGGVGSGLVVVAVVCPPPSSSWHLLGCCPRGSSPAPVLHGWRLKGCHRECRALLSRDRVFRPKFFFFIPPGLFVLLGSGKAMGRRIATNNNHDRDEVAGCLAVVVVGHLIKVSACRTLRQWPRWSLLPPLPLPGPDSSHVTRLSSLVSGFHVRLTNPAILFGKASTSHCATAASVEKE